MSNNYLLHRPNIKSGDMLIWSSKRWDSLRNIKVQLIRIFTRSEYNHTGIAWVIGSRVFVIEAVTPKVRIYPLSKLDSFYHISMNLEWNTKTEEFALSTVGHGYSTWQAILSFFGKSIQDDLWECAELVAEVYRIENIDLGSMYTPSAIVEKALELNKQLKFISMK